MEKTDHELLSYLFWHLVEKYEAIEEQYWQKNGLENLTRADIRAVHRLGLLRREKMSNLARHLRLTVGTLTTTINRLVEKGYVLRNRPEEDRRIVEVTLSPEGQEAFSRIDQVKKIVADHIFGPLNDEEKKVLYNLLKKLNQEG
ncbi:MarR family transcriptional regulator [Thermosyntropha sp.]|uniref:MarR family winged helix-turn-helix transcriptional regulator n=1 Tax=Thermosyntropha sp. TaxID=2740820 RepID=UPI0025ED505E|nr:MarR family transcriptional regulator [Thermosyntropha sp.]MBO8159141.1 MarR family transcriptional regulator [Thermosyntropha sp.]